MGRFVTACLLSSGAVALASCSPFGNSGTYFTCTEDSQCISGPVGETAGMCIGGACAYTDESCTDNLRYGSDSSVNTSVAGKCVGAETAADAGGGGGGGGIDAEPAQHDAPVAIGIDARECWGDVEKVCFHPPPAMSSKDIYATTGQPGCTEMLPQGSGADAGPPLCVMVATNWTFKYSGGLATHWSGANPILLFATDTIKIEIGAELSVSSFEQRQGEFTALFLGPDADGSDCKTPNATNNSAGGTGGSFATAGGAGGGGTGSDAPVASTAALPIDYVMGGCRGQAGRAGGSSNNGGHGGGAIYLLAGSLIDLEGPLLSNGQGGQGGAAQQGGGAPGGGGGGGTGGFLGLEAPTITINAAVLARGGGGGGGGGVKPGGPPQAQATDGGNGDDGSVHIPADGGGGGTSKGGDGGSGSKGTGGEGGVQGTGGAAGGGGGAGDGVIWTHGAVTGASNIVPPAIVKP